MNRAFRPQDPLARPQTMDVVDGFRMKRRRWRLETGGRSVAEPIWTDQLHQA